MCDYSGKLIAWLDRELPAEESAALESHLESCVECRSDAQAYKRVSVAFDAYCEETGGAHVVSTRAMPRWVPALIAASALAVFAALFLAWPRPRPRTVVESQAIQTPPKIFSASHAFGVQAIPGPASDPRKIPPPQRAAQLLFPNENAAPAQNQNESSLPADPVVQIAIPADEMFPPGSLPEGMNFVADVTIAADGSAERIRLRPRLTEFERSTTHP
jgi:anti-sigma factor RsiW